MTASTTIIPVVLFAYARSEHLDRVLACLRENRVPLIYAFADGAKAGADAESVARVRAILRAVDWCEIRVIERAENWGLGRNVLAGVTHVAASHDAFVVWEDDLVCVPGTYDWMCAALRHYATDPRVMSVTAWTHPRVTPPGRLGRPYFDARAECWCWGTWARTWRGMMEQTALEKIAALAARGIAADVIGADLTTMARVEQARNIWAVRWLYHHLQYDGLCLRPPHSMIEHVGFDASATNAANAVAWENPPLETAPLVPSSWPAPNEHPWCRRLWRAAAPAWPSRLERIRRRAGRVARQALPEVVLRWWRHHFRAIRWEGDFTGWAAAVAVCEGYAGPEILSRVEAAVRQVRAGEALFERDGVAFQEPPPAWPVLEDLLALAKRQDGVLTVLDFGGSLGSTYFNYRFMWDEIPQLRWRVIEQPAFVAAGRREFADGRLEFHGSVAEAMAAGRPDVLLLASVLPYVPEPHILLRTLLGMPYRFVLVERTGMVARPADRLTVQQVPAEPGRASYPCWFFNRGRLLAHFAADYDLIREETTADGVHAGADFRSFWFRRKEHA